MFLYWSEVGSVDADEKAEGVQPITVQEGIDQVERLALDSLAFVAQKQIGQSEYQQRDIPIGRVFLQVLPHPKRQYLWQCQRAIDHRRSLCQIEFIRSIHRQTQRHNAKQLAYELISHEGGSNTEQCNGAHLDFNWIV